MRVPTIDDYVRAILDRDQGTPYHMVLERYGIRPNQFFRAVRFRTWDSELSVGPGLKQELDQIVGQDQRKRELFRMGDEFVRSQYDRLTKRAPGKQRHYYEGTFYHQENSDMLAYYGLVVNNPRLDSPDRAQVIQEIKNLPDDLKKYIKDIKLMFHIFKYSPLAVIEAYDRARQIKTGDASLFDLAEELHLHRWGDFKAPQNYWQNQARVEEAVHHMLTTHTEPDVRRLLSSGQRSDVVRGILSLPSNLSDYFSELGLESMVANAFEGSPLAVLRFFDTMYQKRFRDASLFDLKQSQHLHRWGDNFNAPLKYWLNPDNLEEAVYHTLTENTPQLTSDNRGEVIRAITNLPGNLQDYFHGIGLGSLMQSFRLAGKKDSPLAVIEAFDRVYQRRTSDSSLFDLANKEHLHKWGLGLRAPKDYWKNPDNVEGAVYHTLVENNPGLGSENRERVVREIVKLPGNLQDYFHGIGLGGLMTNFRQGKDDSPEEILRVFDQDYQKQTGNPSLFDKTKPFHLEIDGQGRLIRRAEWIELRRD